MCEAFREILDKVAKELVEEKRVKETKNNKWARNFWKRVRSTCRRAAARQKRLQKRVAADSPRTQGADPSSMDAENKDQGEQRVEEDGVAMVQTGIWLEALQEDLDFRRAGGEPVGAHATQLMCHLQQLQSGANQEAWQAVEALLATYVGEETDESRGDLADEFAECWKERLVVLPFPRRRDGGGHARNSC